MIRRRTGGLGCCVCAAALAWASAALAGIVGSPLAVDLLITEHGEPQLWLAQRTIEREWTAPDDPEALASHVAGGKSELGAASLSALLPGSGQLYVGEKSGYAFLLAEAVSWAGLLYYNHQSDDHHATVNSSLGSPADSASAWSFQRYATRGGDPARLEALYQADQPAFYDAIASDPRFSTGWASGAEQQQFVTQLSDAQSSQHRVNQFSALLWLNRVVAAADAFRAARLHNLPLQRNLELKANGGFHHGRPDLTVTLVRKF